MWTKAWRAWCFLFFLFFLINLFILLFVAVVGLRFCARAFSSCGARGPLFIAVRGPLTIAASLVAEHGLQTRRLSSCGSRAQPLRGMWDLPRPGLEPVSPALAGRLSTAAPAGKPGPDVWWALLAESPYMAPVYEKRYLNGNVSTSLGLFSFLLSPCNKEISFTWWLWKIFSGRIILWFDPMVSKTLKTRKWSCRYMSSIHAFV